MGLLGLPTVASAASITPSSYEATIGIGETVTVKKTVTLDKSGPASSLVDVFFLADNTGSMGSIINEVKTSASSILNSISGGDSRFSGIDVGFGVGSYLGDPVEGVSTTTAYSLLSSISKNKTTTQTAIDSWFASGGGDLPEANFFALHQVATSGGATDGIGESDTGVGTGQNTGWREGAARVLVWFGDASSHEETVNLEEATNALVDNDVKVAAINTQNAGNGIDTSDQATDIAAATGGTLTNDVDTSGVVDAILAAVGSAVATTDLELFVTGNTSGVDVSFACTDPLGCEDVGPGESRSLTLSITGKTPGVYSFETGVKGLAGVVEKDNITVVPEPMTILGSLTAGLFGTGLMRKRKQMQAAQAKADA
jgi:hypothetical protein